MSIEKCSRFELKGCSQFGRLITYDGPCPTSSLTVRSGRTFVRVVIQVGANCAEK
jgi:hypothetical protein